MGITQLTLNGGAEKDPVKQKIFLFRSDDMLMPQSVGIFLIRMYCENIVRKLSKFFGARPYSGLSEMVLFIHTFLTMFSSDLPYNFLCWARKIFSRFFQDFRTKLLCEKLKELKEISITIGEHNAAVCYRDSSFGRKVLKNAQNPKNKKQVEIKVTIY